MTNLWLIQITAPITVIIFKAICEYSNIGEHLATKKTPAVTMVAGYL